jgi:hypothetical protein
MSAQRDRIGVDDTMVTWPDDAPAIAGKREFHSIGDGERYLLQIIDVPIELELDHVRRERGELFGELTVRTTLLGARTFQETLDSGTFNVSSSSARTGRAKVFAELARSPQIDWHRLLSEFCIRVLDAERRGQPGISLRDVPHAQDEGLFDVDGIVLTKRSPSQIYGDGSTFKSSLALHIAGHLHRRGIATGFFDYELDDPEPHRQRAEAMFGLDFPPVHYVSCARPLIHEVDRLRRIIVDQKLTYVIIDSVAPACHDDPSSAEAATTFFRALRQLRCGSLLIAHIPKGAERGAERPFGSQFFWNLSRSIWYAQAQPAGVEGRRIALALHHRKFNLGSLRASIGLSIEFGAESTSITRCNIADIPELAAAMPMWQRIQSVLRSGAKSQQEIADELDVKVDSVKKAIGRGIGRTFVKLSDHRIGLVERHSS